MVDIIGIEKPARRKRRHSEEFKDELVRACSEPGVSVAGIALSNGINTNLLRKWMEARGITAPSLRRRVPGSSRITRELQKYLGETWDFREEVDRGIE